MQPKGTKPNLRAHLRSGVHGNTVPPRNPPRVPVRERAFVDALLDGRSTPASLDAFFAMATPETKVA